ncbi:hypothetical protein ACPCKL_32075 [Streptomyces cellulosae]
MTWYLAFTFRLDAEELASASGGSSGDLRDAAVVAPFDGDDVPVGGEHTKQPVVLIEVSCLLFDGLGERHQP